MPGVIPAKAGIQRLFVAKTLGPRLRGDDNKGAHPMEVEFTREVEQLKLGAGATFEGEGILAITKALLESGVAYVGGYQGAPVSHLLDVMVQAKPYLDELGVHVEPCANEASAAAMLGASIHYPLRGAVTWKSIVGTNVAADALSNLASPGVTGGALVIVGEDYGEGASVIQERTHAYALKSTLLLLDPRPDLPTMVRMVEHGFRMSEATSMPAILELRIRACHVRGRFVCRDNRPPAVSTRALLEEPAPFDYGRLAHPPVTFQHEKRKIDERLPAARRYIVEHALNESIAGSRNDIGVIVQGGLYPSLFRALVELGLADDAGDAQVSMLVLNVTHPLVPAQIGEFCAGKRAVLVVEEGSPAYIEQEINATLRRDAIGTPVHGKDLLPAAGEYTVEAIARGMLAFADRYLPDAVPEASRQWLDGITSRRTAVAARLGKALPPRPPQFCIGCPERPVFSALKLAQQHVGPVHIAGDIGCHAFATFEPFGLGHSILGYGMSLASRAGVSPMMQRRTLAVMGDGGFWHNGLLTGVQSALFNGDDAVLLIFKNGYTSATGTQDIISTPSDAAKAHATDKARSLVDQRHDDRADARRSGRQVDAHREHLRGRQRAPHARGRVHERLRRSQGHHRRGRVPARAPAPRQAVDRRPPRCGQARDAGSLRRRRGRVQRRPCVHTPVRLPDADAEGIVRSAAAGSGRHRHRRLRRLRAVR